MPRTHHTAEESVSDVMAQTGPPKARSFGAASFSILGRVAADPTVRYTASGKAVLDLVLATIAAGATTFTAVILWERAAEVVGQYATKGREMWVEGRIGSRTREIEGRRLRQIDLIVENFQLLGRASSTQDASGEQTETEGAA